MEVLEVIMKKHLAIILAFSIGALTNLSLAQANPSSEESFNQLALAIRQGDLSAIQLLEKDGVPITSPKLLKIAEDAVPAIQTEETLKNYERVYTYVQSRVIEAFDAKTAEMNKEFFIAAGVLLGSMCFYQLLWG